MSKWLGLTLAVCLAGAAFAQVNPGTHALRVYDKNHPPSNGCNGNPCDINYNGGPVFEKAPNVYIIYYGSWTATDRSIIDYFFSNLSGTTMEQINTTYSDSTGTFIPNAVNYNPATNSFHNNYGKGKNVNDSTIRLIIHNAITKGKLPNDPNGIYFVLTYSDVNDSGFCSQFCGYHGPSTTIESGEVIKYAMVGNPARCPSACEASYVVGDSGSPNNDPGADGTVNIMWHELSESSSDPEVNYNTAWAGNFCGESGDCCAWLFGTLQTDSNGHKYTNTIGTKNFIAQTMLELTSTSRTGNIPGECMNTYQ
jgi:hypothetical protein